MDNLYVQDVSGVAFDSDNNIYRLLLHISQGVAFTSSQTFVTGRSNGEVVLVTLM